MCVCVCVHVGGVGERGACVRCGGCMCEVCIEIRRVCM